MEHRKTPSRKAFVPPGWFIVLTILVVIGSAGWLGWLLVDDDPDAPDATPTVTSSTPTPGATTPSPAKTTPAPEETTPAPTKTTAPPVARDVQVSVLNNTTIRGLAASYSNTVRQAGWTLGGIGNWRGSVGGNTVYYPAAYEAQGKLLAKDLDISRVLPVVAGMRTDRLTIILSGPQ